LTQEVYDGLEEQMVEKVFERKVSKFDLCDHVMKETQEFQMKTIPNDFSEKDESSLKAALSLPSCWASCYGQYGLEYNHSTVNVDVESYWHKVFLHIFTCRKYTLTILLCIIRNPLGNFSHLH